MQSVTLQRINYGKLDTLGSLILPSGLVLSTIERPWLDNASGISCIPEGEYLMLASWSPHMKRVTYLLQSVPGRDCIRVHSANWSHQLRGCIAPGLTALQATKTNPYRTAVSSKLAIKRLEEELKMLPAKIVIRGVK